MAKIKRLKGREILDSRGNPTIETEIFLDNEISASASVPSGASVGSHEALELRDGDPNRFFGMGVLKAVANVEEIIAPKIIGLNPENQEEIDNLLIRLDGTENKSRLGANSILSVSLAMSKVAAVNLKLPLYKYISRLAQKISLPTAISEMPTPTFNIINGGKHGAGNLDFQEFHVIPATNLPYHKCLEEGEEIYQALKKVLEYRGIIHSVGDEGGFAPNLFTNMDALDTLSEAISSTSYKMFRDVFLGLDIASSYFYKDGRYNIKDQQGPLSTDEMIDFYRKLISQRQLIYLEDAFSEDDWQGWKMLTTNFGRNTLIVGDDLIATNLNRLKQAIEEKAINAVLIKPNQIGTLSETLEVIKQAKEAGLKTIVSHRSGETNDTLIADLAVGTTANYIKFGAPARGERVAKYNRLLEIEEELQPLFKE